MPAPEGFNCQVLTNNPLILNVLPGTAYVGGNQSVTTPTTPLTLAASTVTYVYFNPPTASIATNTTGFTAGTVPLAIVTTNTQAISFIADVRAIYGATANGALYVTASPAVLQTCNSTVQNVATYTLPNGLLSQTGKSIRFKAFGVLNTSSASGLQLGLQLTGTNVCLINTANITTSLTNQPWMTEMTLTVANAGATGNVEGHGTITCQLTAAGAGVASTVTQDIQTAVSANVNLSGALTLGFIALTNGAIVNFTARMATLEILN